MDSFQPVDLELMVKASAGAPARIYTSSRMTNIPCSQCSETCSSVKIAEEPSVAVEELLFDGERQGAATITAWCVIS
jgi:hypothetical protein